MACAQQNKLAEWDAPTSQIVSLTTTSGPPSSWKPSLPRSDHSDLNMGSWSWGLSTPFVYAPQPTSPGNFEDCMERRVRRRHTPMRTKPSVSHDDRLTFPVQRFRLPSAKAKFEPPEQPNYHAKKVTILRDGRCSPMDGLIPLMVKPQPVGAPSPAHPMEDCMSCLTQLLPRWRILRMLGLECGVVHFLSVQHPNP